MSPFGNSSENNQRICGYLDTLKRRAGASDWNDNYWKCSDRIEFLRERWGCVNDRHKSCATKELEADERREFAQHDEFEKYFAQALIVHQAAAGPKLVNAARDLADCVEKVASEYRKQYVWSLIMPLIGAAVPLKNGGKVGFQIPSARGVLVAYLIASIRIGWKSLWVNREESACWKKYWEKVSEIIRDYRAAAEAEAKGYMKGKTSASSPSTGG
jgi:hypothetical protein